MGTAATSSVADARVPAGGAVEAAEDAPPVINHLDVKEETIDECEHKTSSSRQ